MIRSAATLAVFAALAAWASAQHPHPGLTAGEHLKLLQSNRHLIERLLDDGVRLSDGKNSALDRAEGSGRAARTLAAELKKVIASPSPDADRVAELADHLTVLVRDGVAPTLKTAREQIAPGSPDFGQLKREHDLARQSFGEARDAIPTAGKLGQSAKVRDARGKLDEAVRLIGE